jgi:peptide/nickel transport system ATP-binding protein
MLDTPLLSVENLSIRAAGARAIVDAISFQVGTERVALVGESGSGKSLTARAVMGLLPSSLSVSAERLEFDGLDLRHLTPRQWKSLRGSAIALVLQDPRHALNPVLNVGRQIDEAIRLHRKMSAAERRDRIFDMLEAVGLAAPQRVINAYPHQLSGGMGQRVMLAIMLINGPRLLIADEPTSALDAALRDQALELMTRLVETRRMGMLLISHDLQQVTRYCQRALVMYQGRLVEECAATALAGSNHAYTRALWSCRPSGSTYRTRLPVPERNVDTGQA